MAMFKKSLSVIAAVAVVGACGADDSLSDFSNDLFTDLGPLIALFGDSMTKQFLSESTTFLDYFIFAMCPIGIITTIVSAIRLCGHSSLRAFIGRSQEGNGVIEAELCTSTSRDVCELFSGGGIARVLGRPTILELVLVKEKKPNCTTGLYILRQLFQDMPKTTSPWTRLKDSQGQLSSSASNPPNLSLNVGIVKQEDWKFLVVAILGFILQAGILALAGVGVWVFHWNLNEGGNPSSRNYAPIMFILGTVTLCGGSWVCAALIGESTQEIRYKRNPDPQQDSLLIWLQPHQVIGDQSFDPFAYLDEKNSIKVWTASKKELQHGQHKMYQARTFVGISAVLVGYIMQFIGLRGMKAWISLTQLGITIFMSILRGLLRMQRLDSSGKDNKLADKPDLVEGYELEWLALEINGFLTRGSAHDQALVVSEFSTSTTTDQAAIACQEVLFQRRDSIGNHPLQSLTSYTCPKHHGIATKRKRLLLIRERLCHLTGHFSPKGSLNDGEFVEWKDSFVKVRSKAKSLSTALSRIADSLFSENVSGILDVHLLGFIDPANCTTCHKDYAASVEMKGPDRTANANWIIDSAKIEALLGLILWSLLSDERLIQKPDYRSPFESSWAEGIHTKKIFSIGSSTKGIDRQANAQAEVDLWLGPNQLQISEYSLSPAEVTEFNLCDLWRKDENQRYTWAAANSSNTKDSRDSWGRFCGWKSASMPFDPSKTRIELSRASDSLPSRQTGSQPMIRAQCFLIKDSLIDLCTKELFSALLFDMGNLLKVENLVVNEVDGQVRLHIPAVNTLSKVFVEAGLGSYSESLLTIIPALRRCIYADGPQGFFEALLRTARTYRRQSHWKRAEALLQWACNQQWKFYDDPKTKAELFVQAFMATGELYRYSLCQVRNIERTEFGDSGITWMKEPFSTFVQKTKIFNDEMMVVRNGYKYIQKKMRLDSNVESAMPRVLKIAIQTECREDALYSLCWVRADSLAQDDSLPGLLPSIAKKNWFETLSALLESQVNPDGQDQDGRTAISFAAELDHRLCAMALIRHEALLDVPDKVEQRTPMMYAARHGHNSMTKQLLNSGRVNIDWTNKHGMTPMSEAIASGHEETVLLLLTKGAKVRTGINGEHNALLSASQRGSVSIAQLLIKYDPSCISDHVKMVESMTTHEENPLWYAVRSENKTLTQLLLDKGAVIDAKDSQDRTMLHLAAENDHETLISYLIGHSAFVNSQDRSGRTALHVAVESGHEAAVRLLLQHGVSVDIVDQDGATALHVAARNTDSRETIVGVLLKNNATTNMTTGDGMTPLFCAAQSGHVETVKQLLAKDASIDQADKRGRTPLLVAVTRTNRAVMKVLLTNGASIDQPDDGGRTPLLLAVMATDKAAVQVLLANGASIDQPDTEGRTPLTEAESMVSEMRQDSDHNDGSFARRFNPVLTGFDYFDDFNHSRAKKEILDLIRAKRVLVTFRESS